MALDHFSPTSLIKSLSLGLILVGVSWLTTKPVQAQIVAPNAIQIEPAFQEISVADTAASVEGQLKLTNTSSLTQTFDIFALEIKQFDNQGRVILADRPLSSDTLDQAEFVSIPKTSWTVDPNQTTTVPFWIKNTPRLAPGGHYTALVARLQATQASNQQVLPAVSSFVLVRKIGGEVYHLSLSQVTELSRWWWWTTPQKLTLLFSNDGNIHVVPRGTVELIDLFGTVRYHGAINEASLYVFPGTQREIPAELKPTTFQWPVMLYKVVITARSEPGDVPAGQSSSVIVIQPWFVGGFVLVIGILVVGGWRWKWFRRRQS